MSLVNNSQSTCRGTIDPVPQQSTAAASSDAPRSSKRDTEHEDSGGDSKRLHSEVADTQMPHGDVVPQTSQSEAGRDLVDDTSFEDMMSPNKIAKHGDGPGSVNLLGQLRQIEHLDIEPDVFLQEQDFDVMLQHELNLDEDPYEPVSELSNRMKELSYPYDPQEPQLELDELQRLDSIADQVEIERLFGLHVLLEDTLPADAKCLSTRFVRTWREKKDDAGNAIWLRRSRLGQGIHLVAARQRSLALTGFLQHCNQDLAHLFSCFEGTSRDPDACN